MSFISVIKITRSAIFRLRLVAEFVLDLIVVVAIEAIGVEVESEDR
jgi:hypothetical protein